MISINNLALSLCLIAVEIDRCIDIEISDMARYIFLLTLNSKTVQIVFQSYCVQRSTLLNLFGSTTEINGSAEGQKIL